MFDPYEAFREQNTIVKFGDISLP